VPAVNGQKVFLGILVGVPVALLIAGTVALRAKQSTVLATTQTAQVFPSPLPNAQTSPVRSGKLRGSGNANHDALLARGDRQRTAALSLMVKRSGHECSGTRNYFQRLEPTTRDATWNVACRDGKAYSVMVSSKTGGAKVVDCATLKLAGRECFRK
jgi:hypothetical protein